MSCRLSPVGIFLFNLRIVNWLAWVGENLSYEIPAGMLSSDGFLHEHHIK